MKTALKYLFSIFVTLFFLYFAFRGTDLSNLWQILSGANYWWVLASLPPLFISHLFRAWRWEYLLRPVKPNLRFRNLFSAMIVGYMLNNVLPRAGEIARPYAIGKLEGVSRSAAFGTVFMERIFDVLSFMVVIALIPVVYSGPLTQILPWLEETSIWISAITLAILACLVFLMIRRDIVVRFMNFLSRFLPKKYADIVSRITHSFLDGFLFLKDRRSYAMIVFLSAMVWIFYIIMMYLPFLAFGLTRDHGLDWNAALVIQAISSIGFMMPTPGATGSYHYFVIESMTKLYGVNMEIARSYATVTHAVGFLATMVVGLYFFLKDKLHLSEFSGGASVPETIGGTVEHGS
ncbi:MAG TPA: lysylphosphatidylglycerol synthase transmembrane domain-containing protein [Bacteroidota bacterium]|nr:lysylphosphatidylglycerol synthase transmembrane domain-containing protein [Bacteroidota bacterium]